MDTQTSGAPRECHHSSIEYLGDNRDARFLRCEGCGQVFVLQAGQAWSLPAVAPKEPPAGSDPG